MSMYSTFANKWEFEQMGVWVENRLLIIREQMGVYRAIKVKTPPPP